MHRSERVNPTTRSWIPPRTFFTQVRFLRPGEKPPRPGSPAPPSGPENAGQTGQKSALQASFPGGVEGCPEASWQHGWRHPGGGGARPYGRPGKQTQRPTKTTGSDGPTTSKIPRHTPAPARQIVHPTRAEHPAQGLQPPPGHADTGRLHRTSTQRRRPGYGPDAGGSQTPSRGREKKEAPARPRFADQLREEESNSQQPAPPEGRFSESSDQ